MSFQDSKRWWITGFVAAIAVAIFTVGIIFLPKPTVAAPRKVTLTLKWLFDPGFAGEMIAKRNTYFMEEGMDVQLQPGGFEIDPVRLVASRSSEFGVAGADTFLIARSRGLPIVAIASGYIQTPVAYYVHADSNINKVEDFAGKTVGVQAGQDTETLYLALIGKAGIQRKEINEFPVKYDMSPFLTKRLDVWPGYIATQSYILKRQGVPFRTIRPTDSGLKVPGTVYFTNERFLKEHPGLVSGFVRAVKNGWQFAYSREAEAANLISSFDEKSLPVDLVISNLRDQKDQIIPDGYALGELRMDDWREMMDVLEKQRLLFGPVDLNTALWKGGKS